MAEAWNPRGHGWWLRGWAHRLTPDFPLEQHSLERQWGRALKVGRKTLSYAPQQANHSSVSKNKKETKQQR